MSAPMRLLQRSVSRAFGVELRGAALLFFMSLMLALSACQQTRTLSPRGSDAEIRRERALHQELAADTQAQQATPGEAPLAYSVEQRQAFQEQLDRVTARVVPAAKEVCAHMHAKAKQQEEVCRFRVVMGESPELNAYADGKRVVIQPGMIAFTANPTELAYILAHELTHHMMQHPQSTRRNALVGGLLGALVDGVATRKGYETNGAFSALAAQGAILAYSKDFEREADYMGLYVLARAGYPLAKAPEVWRRMSARQPGQLYIGTTHPTNPQRFVSMQKTIAEIRRKRQAGTALLPTPRLEASRPARRQFALVVPHTNHK